MQLGQQQLRTQLLKLHTWESEQASFFFPQHRAATKTGEEDLVEHEEIVEEVEGDEEGEIPIKDSQERIKKEEKLNCRNSEWK